VLRDGHVFVGWGRALTISEFSHEGELLFDASLPRGNKSYRAFRFPWRGYPTDRPACVAESASEEEARVYASWNGATEVATWEVLAGGGPGELEPVGSAPRKGFETAITLRTDEPYVAVRAKHGSGRVLGASEALKTIAVVSAVDLLLRPSASWADRLRYGVRCGIVQPPNMTMGQYHCTPL
jgi:hypothetical protein